MLICEINQVIVMNLIELKSTKPCDEFDGIGRSFFDEFYLNKTNRSVFALTNFY